MQAPQTGETQEAAGQVFNVGSGHHFTVREIAERMGVSENTVSDHITAGMRALADIYLGEAAELRSGR